MAFAEADRVQIRRYLGYPQIWLQADPRLENAITNIQSLSDGGTRPNPSPSAAETQAKAFVTSLLGVDASLATLATFMGATRADEASLDAAREQARLFAIGRDYIKQLAAMFDTQPGPGAPYDAGADGSSGPGMAPGPFGGRRGY